jgi:hypothetical protein
LALLYQLSNSKFCPLVIELFFEFQTNLIPARDSVNE